jgi:hypothetical protein
VDRLVVLELFGEQLRAAGVELIPMHGTKKMAAIIEADLLFDLVRQHIAVVVDNVVEEQLPHVDDEAALRAATESRRSFDEELKKVAQLRLDAIQKGRRVHIYGIPSPDIVAELDGDIIREVQGCSYPGREKSIAAWREVSSPEAGGQTWKKFCAEKYGLRTDPDDIAPVVERMRERGVIPDNLARAADWLVRLPQVAAMG